MKTLAWVLALALVPAAVLAAVEPVPVWSYFFPERPGSGLPERAGPRTLPGSSKSYTQAQIDDLKNPPDWFPDRRPPAPQIITKGGPGLLFACGSCHLMSGMGHPESSSLAGLPAGYMERQIAEFRSGARKNQVIVDGKPQNNAVQWMIEVAEAMSEAESKDAARYFAALKPLSWVKVEETAQVPRSFVNAGYMRVPDPQGGTEPLGQRIVELPQDLDRQILRDPASGTVAYVPVGSVARGKALVGGGPGGAPCATCHGADLKGLGDIPGVAGRSPTYVFRQLWFFKDGGRTGPMAALMTPSVVNLSQADMIAVSAYLATLAP